MGYEFCESESDSLQDCIRQASLRYFLRYHEYKLDELRIFLESEGWQVCPVRADFDACQLHEFKFLSSGQSLSKQTSPTKKKSCFEVFVDSGTPFDIQKEESDENIYAVSVAFLKMCFCFSCAFRIIYYSIKSSICN